MRKRFLLVNLKTGTMDGFYDSHESAKSGLKEFKRRKEFSWVVTEILDEDRNSLNLPDNLFHCTSGSVANEKLLTQYFQKVMANQQDKKEIK